jgi:hypothetical protein
MLNAKKGLKEEKKPSICYFVSSFTIRQVDDILCMIGKVL